MNMYQELLKDHYQYPRNRGKIEHPHFVSGQYNPSCGDNIELEGCIEHDLVYQIRFMGQGCVISQATASLLTQHCLNKKIQEILEISAADIMELIGMQLGPIRKKCALLSLIALQDGLNAYLKKQEVTSAELCQTAASHTKPGS